MGKGDEGALARIESQFEQDELAAEQQRQILEQQVEDLRQNRQPAINPYAGMTNEMANLGVATKAAEFQAEQTDIALANSLDAIRASGAGAGGATALAQAALQSKRNISASLEQQEVANQKAAAQGAQQLARLQAEGEKFKFNIQEAREQADMDRASNLLQQQTQAISDYENAIAQAEVSNALQGG